MNKKDLAPVGSPVVFFKRGDRNYTLGKITGYRTNNVHGVEAICEVKYLNILLMDIRIFPPNMN